MAAPLDPVPAVLALVAAFDRVVGDAPVGTVLAALFYILGRDVLIPAVASGATDDEILATCTDYVREGLTAARSDLAGAQARRRPH